MNAPRSADSYHPVAISPAVPTTPTGETWPQALAHHRAWCIAAGVSPQTIRVRSSYLRRLAAAHEGRCPWSLTVDDLAGWLATGDGWSPETRKSARSALRALWGWAVTTGRVGDDPTVRLPRVRVPRPSPRPTPDDVVLRALAVATPRERLMIHLAVTAGLRRAEIAAVHPSRDLSDDVLTVRGKGGKTRVVPLLPWVVDELRALPGGPAFPGADHGHLSADRVGRILARLLGPGWTAHTLRHRAASDWYDASRDLMAVQDLLGHASPVTTRIYVRPSIDHLRAAVRGPHAA